MNSDEIQHAIDTCFNRICSIIESYLNEDATSNDSGIKMNSSPSIDMSRSKKRREKENNRLSKMDAKTRSLKLS